MNVEETLKKFGAQSNTHIRILPELDYHVEEIYGINIIILSTHLAANGKLDIHANLISDNGHLHNDSENIMPSHQQKDGFFHRHNFYEIMYILDGNVYQIIDGKEVIAKKHHLFIMNTDVEHMDCIDENSLVLYIQIPKPIMKTIVDNCVFSNNLNTFFSNSQKSLKKEYFYCEIKNTVQFDTLINKLIDEQKQHLPGHLFITCGLLCRLLMIIEHQDKNSVHYVSEELPGNLSLFRRVEKYLKEHTWNVDNKELLNVFYYSENSLNMLFKNFTGKSVRQYCIDKKLDFSTELLKDPTLSISDIINILGYQNKTYFYKIFKAKYGITPKEYRLYTKKDTLSDK